MNILMLTNTYLPHVGGVARSVEAFANAFRACGHRVLIVAPEFEGMPDLETDIVRVPALQDFQGSGFSFALPVPGLLTDRVDAFAPDLVHSHHPYLLGMTALRVARYRELPLVFTHHTLYEHYTHYVVGNSPGFQRFVAELATVYANLADQVFAPSESLAALLRERGVERPIEIVPTGVDLAAFAEGDGKGFRAAHGIPADAFVVGHVGRLAQEKNLDFLATSIAEFLRGNGRARFLVGGEGPWREKMRVMFAQAGVAERVHFAGLLRMPRLADAYHAMDVFAFTSKSETQGMVLTEAMAAGVPVVGLDAPGVREIVRDGRNGRLLQQVSPQQFAGALIWVQGCPGAEMARMRAAARATAEAFSMPRSAAEALACYGRLIAEVRSEERHGQLDKLLDLVKAEWEVAKGVAEAARHGFGRRDEPEPTLR